MSAPTTFEGKAVSSVDEDKKLASTLRTLLGKSTMVYLFILLELKGHRSTEYSEKMVSPATVPP